MRFRFNFFLICFNLAYLISCEKDSGETDLPSLSSSFKKSLDEDHQIGQAEISPSKEELQDAIFRCTKDSVTIMRFSEEKARMEYCKKGEWAAIPLQRKPRQLPKKPSVIPDDTQKLPTDIKESGQLLPIPTKATEPSTVIANDPLAFRCQKSKKFERSFLCRRSYPDP